MCLSGRKQVSIMADRNTDTTEKDRQLAQTCLQCPMCKNARRAQRGFAFWFVKTIEGGMCPACRAYEKVCGKKAHEPV